MSILNERPAFRDYSAAGEDRMWLAMHFGDQTEFDFEVAHFGDATKAAEEQARQASVAPTIGNQMLNNLIVA